MKEAVLKFLVVLITVAVISILLALILVWLWPLVVPAIFPGWVKNGAIAAHIELGTAIALSVICNLLVRSGSKS